MKELQLREKELEVQLRMRELELSRTAEPTASSVERDGRETTFDGSKHVMFSTDFC